LTVGPLPGIASAALGRHRVFVAGAVTIPDLLLRARNGDIEAFAQFYDQESAPLLRWFARRTAAADIAADLSGETWAKTLQTLGRYRASDPPAPRAWLYGIARNELRHWLRRQAVQQRARQKLGIYVELPSVDDLDLVELRLDLERLTGPLDDALQGLSDPVRSAVLLRVVHQASYSDVAAELGCSEVAARVRVSRGLSELLDRLSVEGPDHG
jgi:RNA polymerase sigma factor (sigma-70 family)